MYPAPRSDACQFTHPFQRMTVAGSRCRFGSFPKLIEFMIFFIGTFFVGQPCTEILIDFFRIVVIDITVDYIANIILHKVIFIVLFRNAYVNITTQQGQLREKTE